MDNSVKKFFKWLLINLGVFTFLLVGAEVAGQLIYRLWKGQYYFQAKKEWIFKDHPFLSAAMQANTTLSGDQSNKIIQTNTKGFRITSEPGFFQKPDQASFNIVCLGGSTTFCTQVSNQETWPYLLQQKLGPQFKVHNLGVPGYTTLENSIQLLTVVPELKPDLILLYQGWNDLRNYHHPSQSADYEWHGKDQKQNLSIASTFQRFFVLSRFIPNVNFPIQKSEIKSTPDPFIDSVYVRNLNTIAALAKRFDSSVLFIPQVINIQKFEEEELPSYKWHPYIANDAMGELMHHFNQLMIDQVTQDSMVHVAPSPLKAIPFQKEHFVDFGHFTPAGNSLFADWVYEQLQPILPPNLTSE